MIKPFEVKDAAAFALVEEATGDVQGVLFGELAAARLVVAPIVTEEMKEAGARYYVCSDYLRDSEIYSAVEAIVSAALSAATPQPLTYRPCSVTMTVRLESEGA